MPGKGPQSRRFDASLPARTPPEDLAVAPLQLGGVDLLVFSYAVEAEPHEARALTSAEQHVAALVVNGLSNAEIAERRGTAVRTVANQVASILLKLGLGSRRQMMIHLRPGSLSDVSREAHD